jgi:hypothetical protein
MGWGALIGSLVSTGVSVAGQLSKGSANAPLAEESSRINEAANQFVVPFAGMNNPYWNIDVPAFAEESITRGFSRAPALNQANMQQLQALLGQALPGYQDMVTQMGAGATSLLGGPTTQAFLGGQVPGDVVNQIQRSAAYRSMMGGTAGAGTGTTGALTARDIGLTSLDLIGRGVGMEQAGFGQTSNLLQLARNYLMPQPINPLSLLPLSDLIQGAEWTKSANYQANLAAFTAKADAAAAQVGAPQQSVLTGIGGELSSLFQQLGTKNPQTGQTGFGMLSGLFGGGGGGNTGGFSLSDLSSLPDDTTLFG